LAWLIGPRTLASPLLDARRARLVLGSTAGLLTILGGGLWVQGGAVGDPVTTVLWAAAATALGVLGLLRLGRTRLAAHLLLADAFAFLAATLWLRQGAPIQLLYFSALIPMSAAFLLSNREMLLWGAASIGLLATTWGLTGAGVLQPDAAALERTAATRFPAAILFQLAFVLAAGAANRVRNATLRQAVESQESYQGLFDHSPLGVAYLDLEGKVISVNDRLVEILGATERGDIEGRQFESQGIAELPDVREALIECQRSGSVTSAEAEWTSSFGRPVHIRAHLAPVRDRLKRMVGLQTVIEDITARARTERALRESEARHRAVIENSSAMIAEADTARRTVRLMGELVWGTLGLEPGEYPLDVLMRGIHPEDRERVASSWTAATSGALLHVAPYRHRTPEGDWTWLESSVRAFRGGDGSARISIATRDVSDRIQLEEQMRQAQKMEALGQLAGGIAHDFNNLLTVITGYAGLLDAENDPQVRETGGQILDAARRGSALTQQLLAFGRSAPPSLRTCDLNPLIGRLEPLLRSSLEEGVELVLDLTPGVPLARVEASLLEQALMNLVLNARDALRDGGTIRIRTRARRKPGSDASAAPAWVAIDVCDDGPGMSAEIAERVFEPFFTTKAHGQGSGLGLAMVYGTVARMGGQASVSSSPVNGTTFTLEFPACEADAAVAEERRSASSDAIGSGRVLVVEDDPAVRRITVRVLARAGYDVLEAADASEALALAEQEAAQLDLVLSDVVMPGRSGVELAVALRERWPALPVLLVTGHPLDRAGALAELPEASLLQKPYTTEALTGSIRNLLERS
jgi:PAS domain S-box-containing protein